MSKLGSCCACGGNERVHNILLYEFKAPIAGKGWGCVVCGLPEDGAVAVVCDDCFAANREVRYVCAGYPKQNARVPIVDVRQGARHAHDLTKH